MFETCGDAESAFSSIAEASANAGFASVVSPAKIKRAAKTAAKNLRIVFPLICE